jgi:hypothetical protein
LLAGFVELAGGWSVLGGRQTGVIGVAGRLADVVGCWRRVCPDLDRKIQPWLVIPELYPG